MRYYSTQRPLGPGTYPKRDYVYDTVENFPDKTYVEEIGREAWGYLDLQGRMPESEVQRWELTPAGRKIYWLVISSVADDGKKTANIVKKVEVDIAPENCSKRQKHKVVSMNWFDSEEKAKKFVEDVKSA